MADEDQHRSARVAGALADGNLMPLAHYLRGGHPVDEVLAAQLAKMIDGEGGTYRLAAIGRRTGQRTFSEINAAHDRKMTIGVYAEARIRAAAKGSADAEVIETAHHFKVGKTTVTSARAYLHDCMARTKVAPGVDLWELMKAVFSED